MNEANQDEREDIQDSDSMVSGNFRGGHSDSEDEKNKSRKVVSDAK